MTPEEKCLPRLFLDLKDCVTVSHNMALYPYNVSDDFRWLRVVTHDSGKIYSFHAWCRMKWINTPRFLPSIRNQLGDNRRRSRMCCHPILLHLFPPTQFYSQPSADSEALWCRSSRLTRISGKPHPVDPPLLAAWLTGGSSACWCETGHGISFGVFHSPRLLLCCCLLLSVSTH